MHSILTFESFPLTPFSLEGIRRDWSFCDRSLFSCEWLGIYGYKEKWDKERGILEESFMIGAQEWKGERKAKTLEALVLLSEKREKKKVKNVFLYYTKVILK